MMTKNNLKIVKNSKNKEAESKEGTEAEGETKRCDRASTRVVK